MKLSKKGKKRKRYFNHRWLFFCDDFGRFVWW